MPAKRKQASLKKTKSTTTYKRGGAKKKMMGGGAAKAMKKSVYQKGGAAGAKKSIGTLDLSKAPGKRMASEIKAAGKAAKSALAGGAGKAATKLGKKRIGTLDLSKPNKKMQDGGMAPMPARDKARARRAQFRELTRPGGLIMDPGALMPGETGPITERQAQTRAMMEGMKGGRDYTPFRSQADSMRTALEQARMDSGAPVIPEGFNPSIPGMKQGGRVLNGKALRNNSRGKARKNR